MPLYKKDPSLELSGDTGQEVDTTQLYPRKG